MKAKVKLNGKGTMILMGIVLVALFYYFTLPAINLHNSGTWAFVIFVALIAALVVFRRNVYGIHKDTQGKLYTDSGIPKKVKTALLVPVVMILIYLIGSILSSPIINAAKYQQLLTVEQREFSEDIQQVNYNQIPLLDRKSAQLLGNRKMGSMVEYVSQFEVSDTYTQINYKEKPVRVTPLMYASTIKWFANQSDGIPAYIMIDMTTQNTECVKLTQPIRYSESEYFNRNIYRHLRFSYPTYIFDTLSFEIDDEGTPYWICPVKKFNIGLFGGQTIGRVVLCNAQTGAMQDYAIDEVPTWVDHCYSAEMLINLYDYYGTLRHGFLNSILSQKDCLQTTDGYNYMAMDDDVWVYTGVTSVAGDESNVGFVLMNERTMQTRYYSCAGAEEYSAMSSAEGQVQNLGYIATFPLLINVNGEPTYFLALKDGAGLVKKYAMVNIQRYQIVAIGDTVGDCEKSYKNLMKSNHITNVNTDSAEKVTGVIKKIVQGDIEGNTHFYILLEGHNEIYDVTLADLVDVVRYSEGDTITMEILSGGDTCLVTGLK